MADFKKSLANGLQAAIDAERRRDEIRQVFAELSNQVLEATDERIQISIEQWDPSAQNTLLKFVDPQKYGPHLAIIAMAVKLPSKNKELLAKWEQSKDGYPCQITLGADVYSCEDKAGLENCLELLLQDPSNGEKLQKLITLTQKQSQA